MKEPAPKERPLTIKQERFVQALLSEPGISATKAAKNAGYSPQTAGVIAYENLKKPQIVSKLGNYNNMVESTILSAVREYRKSPKLSERMVAIDTAKWIHDKVHGKATQATTSVNLNFTGHINQKNYGL